jgi:hypothetical protein
VSPIFIGRALWSVFTSLALGELDVLAAGVNFSEGLIETQTGIEGAQFFRRNRDAIPLKTAIRPNQLPWRPLVILS